MSVLHLSKLQLISISTIPPLSLMSLPLSAPVLRCPRRLDTRGGMRRGRGRKELQRRKTAMIDVGACVLSQMRPWDDCENGTLSSAGEGRKLASSSDQYIAQKYCRTYRCLAPSVVMALLLTPIRPNGTPKNLTFSHLLGRNSEHPRSVSEPSVNKIVIETAANAKAAVSASIDSVSVRWSVRIRAHSDAHLPVHTSTTIGGE